MKEIFFSDWQSIIRILVMSIASYISLIIILRNSGKRTLSKMNAFDFIVTVALGSAFATIVLNKNVVLAEGLAALVFFVSLQVIVSRLSSRSGKINKIIKSQPALIAYKGGILKKNMLSERINEDEIYAAIRSSGLSSLSQIDAIVLETDGKLSVIQKVLSLEDQVIKKVKGASDLA